MKGRWWVEVGFTGGLAVEDMADQGDGVKGSRGSMDGLGNSGMGSR